MARSPPLSLGHLAVYAFTIVGFQAVSGSSLQLGRRAGQTDAICRPQFDWMDNSLGQSPCLVAAHLLAPCQRTGVGNVRAINTTYLAPTADGAEACWCSWGVYNTLEACALCQSDETFTITWYNYRTNCTEQLQPMTEFYPDDTPIADETAVPFWATTNPTTWNNGMFNLTRAEAITNEGHDDVTQASRQAASSSSSIATPTQTDNDSNGSSTNIGVIIGGVVGGVVVILAAVLAAFFFVRYKKKKQDQPQWDYKEPDTTVSPLVTNLPSSGDPRPLSGRYDGVPRIDTNSNLRVDLTGPTHNSQPSYYGGFNAYSDYGGHQASGNTFTVASSSSGIGEPSAAAMDHAISPPPYTDHGVVVPPVKGGRR